MQKVDRLDFSALLFNTGLSLTQKYYELITENPVYAIAVVLSPTQKWNYFDARWIEKEKKVQTASYKDTLQDVWDTQYSNTLPDTPKSPSKRAFLDTFEQFLTPDSTNELELERVTAGDEYTKYCTKLRDPSSPTLPPLPWWLQHENEYPNLTQWAFDIHSIPAISAECERVFSSPGQLLTPRRNRLSDDVVEANECLIA